VFRIFVFWYLNLFQISRFGFGIFRTPADEGD
jgi:hypothetical protein